jgi:homoserine O-acetyltransferase
VSTEQTQEVVLDAFTFATGETLTDVPLAVATYGEYTGDNAVLVCHALTGSHRVAGPSTDARGQAHGWWRDIVGPGRPIDTTEHYVVCVNNLGSCYGSAGPTTPAADGRPHGPRFPTVTVGDWTRAQAAVCDHLGVDRLAAVIGGSVGGMNVLEWTRRFPDRVDRAVAIAAAARLDAQVLAVGLGHLLYLSKSSMQRKFGRRPARVGTAAPHAAVDPTAAAGPYRDVESYLTYQADRFVDRFDANAYLYLTRAMEEYDLAADAADIADAVAAYGGELLLLSFTGDWHFTPEQSAQLAAGYRAGGTPTVHHVVDSSHGHDAFLVEPDKVGPPIAAFLADGTAAVSGVDVDAADPRVAPTEFAPVHSSLFMR